MMKETKKEMESTRDGVYPSAVFVAIYWFSDPLRETWPNNKYLISRSIYEPRTTHIMYRHMKREETDEESRGKKYEEKKRKDDDVIVDDGDADKEDDDSENDGDDGESAVGRGGGWWQTADRRTWEYVFSFPRLFRIYYLLSCA